MSDDPWFCLRPGGWKVSVSTVGTGFHVQPGKGLMGCGNWALNPYHRRGVAGFAANVWRGFGLAYRREYPKSERALRKAIAECEVWCERENAAELAADAIVRRVAS